MVRPLLHAIRFSPVAFSALLTQQSVAQQAPQVNIDKIASIVQQICNRPGMSGTNREISGGVSGDVKTKSIMKKFLGAGLSAEAKANIQNWSGVDQHDLASALAESNKCSEDTFRMMFNRFYAQSPAPLRVPAPAKLKPANVSSKPRPKPSERPKAASVPAVGSAQPQPGSAAGDFVVSAPAPTMNSGQSATSVKVTSFNLEGAIISVHIVSDPDLQIVGAAIFCDSPDHPQDAMEASAKKTKADPHAPSYSVDMERPVFLADDGSGHKIYLFKYQNISQLDNLAVPSDPYKCGVVIERSKDSQYGFGGNVDQIEAEIPKGDLYQAKGQISQLEMNAKLGYPTN